MKLLQPHVAGIVDDTKSFHKLHWGQTENTILKPIANVLVSCAHWWTNHQFADQGKETFLFLATWLLLGSIYLKCPCFLFWGKKNPNRDILIIAYDRNMHINIRYLFRPQFGADTFSQPVTNFMSKVQHKVYCSYSNRWDVL